VAKAWIEDQSDASKLDYDTVLARAVQWASICGTGYKKWVWDATDGGKPYVCAPSFFAIYLDPYAKMFKDCRYIIQSEFMDVEQVYDKYGIDTKVSVAEADETKTALLRGMGCAPALSGVVVNELWMKPSRRHPKGRYAVWTGRDTLIPAGDLPYAHLIENRMLPYTQLGVIERPDSPYYMSPVQFLRPAQMELNVAHNQAFTLRRNFANGKWWLPGGLELQADPDDSPGQILKGMPGSDPMAEPKILQPVYTPMSPDIDILEQGMMHIVGQHEVSQAQVPGRVEAAKAIEMLKESDAGALAVLRKTIQVSNDQGWWQLLQLARAYQTTADMVTSYSKEGIPEVKHFKAGDMKPGHRVRTTMQTGLARSRANRQDLAIRLWEQKVITDPEAMARLLEMPLPNTMSSDAENVILARNENLTIAAGHAVEPGSWNNHTAHIREHNAYRNTHEFEALSPETKQKFEGHVQRHKALEKEQVAAQAELQMIAQGGQPSTPNPAPNPAAPEDPNASQ
jgi:hypothetical protein